MTNKTPNRNQEPEPVRPRFARLLRRRPTPVTPPPIPEGEHILRLTQDLTAALANAARWKGHADSYDQDRERAVEALSERIRQRDDARHECTLLLAWLTALHPATAVIAPAHDPEGTQVLYLVAGGWQMSWPIRPGEVELFRHVTVVDVTDPRAQWDGHGTVQRRERIHNHVRLLALDGDGSMTGVTDDLTTTVRGLQADWARWRGTVLDEVWKALRDAEGGPLIDGMQVVNGLMEQAQAGAAEQEARSA